MNLMSWAELLGNFGEFLGSVLVLITLIYLTAQIRQNTAAMKNQAEQEKAAGPGGRQAPYRPTGNARSQDQGQSQRPGERIAGFGALRAEDALRADQLALAPFLSLAFYCPDATMPL